MIIQCSFGLAQLLARVASANQDKPITIRCTAISGVGRQLGQELVKLVTGSLEGRNINAFRCV